MTKKVEIPAQADALAEYQRGVAERAARMREKRSASRSIPDLSQANEAYDPKRGAMTLDQLGKAQRSLEDPPAGEKGAGLSPATIAGLQALKTEMDKRRVAQPTQESSPMAETAQTPSAEPTKDKEPPKATRSAVTSTLRDMDDFELSHLSARIQRDVINNERERKAVEARLKEEGSEISLEDGLATGSFTQVVPISERLRVTFRTLSPHENRCIRLLLWKWVSDDPRLENLASDVYGMMLIVAAVSQINSNRLPDHLKGDLFRSEFDEEVFTQKYNLLSRYPAPLVHALGVHGNWFDERVRAAFTSEALKNG